MPSRRDHSIGTVFSAALSFGSFLKSPAGLSCLPHHQVGLREVQPGSRMDKETDRKATKRREDALAHSSVLPGHHSLNLRGELKYFSLKLFLRRMFSTFQSASKYPT